jgi:hypothetical protein
MLLLEGDIMVMGGGGGGVGQVLFLEGVLAVYE